MAAFPLIPKRAPMDGRNRLPRFPATIYRKTGATMQPESGIIDCAFENS